MVISMPSKCDQVLYYIESLPINTRVSSQKLADTLHVSIGTAYQAIKKAEQAGLVRTSQKVGTTRIRERQYEPIFIRSLSQKLGCIFATGEDIADTSTIACFYVADGTPRDLEHFRSMEPRPVLCIVGDRPDIQQVALRCGCHLLLTNGIAFSNTLVAQARLSGLILMQTNHNTFTAVELICSDFEQSFPLSSVKQWMRPPYFLFTDDRVMDWYRINSDSPAANYIVVNHSMEVCGMLDAMSIYGADPFQKIAAICADNNSLCFAKETDSISAVSNNMISGHKPITAVVKDGQLTGVLTQDDIIRFYKYRYSADTQDSLISHLEFVDRNTSEGKAIFRSPRSLPLLSDGSFDNGFFFSLLLFAAKTYCQENSISSPSLEYFTFSSGLSKMSGAPFLFSVQIVSQSPSQCKLELDIYDDMTSYGKCSMFFSVG